MSGISSIIASLFSQSLRYSCPPWRDLDYPEKSEWKKQKTFAPDRLWRNLCFILLMCLPFSILAGRAIGEFIIAILIFFFLARAIWFDDWRFLKLRWFQLAVLFWVYQVGISFFALEPTLAFRRTLPFIRFPLLAAAISTWLITNKRDLYLFAISAILAGLYCIADGLWEYSTGVDFGGQAYNQMRITGPFDRGMFGTYLVKITLPMTLFFIWRAYKSRHHLRQSFGFITLSLICLALFLSGARMAIILLLFAFLLFSLLIKGFLKTKITALLISFIALGTFISLSPAIYNKLIKTSLIEFNSKEAYNVAGYRQVMRMAFDVAGDRPLIGVGPYNFHIASQQAENDPYQISKKAIILHPHNLYLELFTEMGIIGFTLFCWIILTWFVTIYKNFAPSRGDPFLINLALVILLLFLFPLNIGSSLFDNQNGLIFWMMTGSALAMVYIWQQQAGFIPPEDKQKMLQSLGG